MVGEDFGAEEEEEEKRESGGFRNTRKQTGWAANLFRKWLSENGFEPGFESLPAAELNRALREFYRGVRNHDGNTYSVASYKSLRAGLNRHLQSRSGQLPRRLCLIRDQEFSGANRAFTDVLKTLQAEGKDSPRYHTPVSPQDLRKIRHSGILGFQNPQSLVNKVWFDLQLHFAKRGSEMHRDLPHDAFRILRAPSGRRYAAFRYPAKGKRGYGDPERAGKMYDVPGDPYCPVFSLELYLSKLPPDPPAFYLRPVKLTPSQMQQQPVWYKREPMGVNYLGTMMPRLSSEARLSRRYTNHSLRSTAIRLLYDAGLGPREIMEVTGHRSAIRHLREVSEARYGTREAGEGSGEKGGEAYGRIEEESGRRVELIDRNSNIDIKDLSDEADRAVLCYPPPSG